MQSADLTATAASPSDLTRPASVAKLFAEQSRLRPTHPALVEGDRRIVYQALESRANQLAGLLLRHHVVSGSRVVVCANRGIELAVALLGVLKAGAAYVPLDPESPPDRLRTMADEVSPSVAILGPGCRSRLSAPTVPVIELDRDFSALANLADVAPESESRPDSAAYVMFTSGSTGQPKGVVVTHANIVNLVSEQSYVVFGPDRRFLMTSSPAFDALTFELWGALLHGATCVIHAAAATDFRQLERTMHDQRVTTCFFTARLFDEIIDIRPSVLRFAQQVVVGGETLSAPHVRRALRLLPGVRLVNGYGPTEATTFSCAYAIPADGKWPDESVPIGIPITGAKCVILDSSGRPVPPGQPGELWIGGAGVGQGYFKRPELTAERFSALRVGSMEPRWFYRTSDRCRLLPSGDIAFLGRLDHQIKLRGQRLELEEIETVLRRHPSVQEAVVVVTSPAAAASRLVAFIRSPSSGPTLHDEQIRAWVSAHLPRYMCPSEYRMIDRFPRGPGGKIDRAAMTSRSGVALAARPRYRRPESPLEKLIVAVWAEALGAEFLGVDDDFFRKGGDSLLATRVVVDLEASLGCPLQLAAVYEHPTAAALAEHLAHDGASAGEPTLRGSGPGAPLCYIPGLYGFSALPRALARRLEGVCPYCDGIRFPGQRTGEVPFETTEEIARDIVAQIRGCAPSARYSLAGFSHGGELAFEVAHQLIAAGHEVERVFLIGSENALVERRRGTMSRRVASLWFQLTRDRGERLRKLRHLLSSGSLRALRNDPIAPPQPIPHEVAEHRQRFLAAAYRARAAYRWRAVSTQGVYLRATEPEFSLEYSRSGRTDGGWDGLFAGGLKIIPFRCRHIKLFVEPYITDVAEAILQEIDGS